MVTLHRLKEDVLKQLPEKVHEVLHCEMTEPQKKYYEETKERYQKKIHKQCKKKHVRVSGRFACTV